MKMGMGILNIQPSDFWNMTFSEFWTIYQARFGNQFTPLSKNEYEEMKREWLKRG